MEKVFRFGLGIRDENSLFHICCYVNNIELGSYGLQVHHIQCYLYDSGGAEGPYIMDWNLKQVGNDSANLLFAADEKSYEEKNDEDYQSFWMIQSGDPIFTFRVELRGLSDQYRFYRFDAHLGQQLWTAATNQKMTDIVYQVFDSTFPAHKFILAARCPVFRAMFDANMTESRTGRVQIVDADPEIFEQFLHFLYTGQLIKPVSKELGMVAEKYQMDTLVALCSAYVAKKVTIEDGLLMSYANLDKSMTKASLGFFKNEVEKQ